MNHPRMRIAGIAALAMITGAACVFEAVSATGRRRPDRRRHQNGTAAAARPDPRIRDRPDAGRDPGRSALTGPIKVESIQCGRLIGRPHWYH